MMWAINIPELPTSANKILSNRPRVQAGNVDRLKRSWIGGKRSIGWLAAFKMIEDVPPPTGKRKVLLEFTTKAKTGRMPDPDNLCSKWFRDCFTAVGLIRDDSLDWADFRVISIERGVADQTRITIMDNEE